MSKALKRLFASNKTQRDFCEFLRDYLERDLPAIIVVGEMLSEPASPPLAEFCEALYRGRITPETLVRIRSEALDIKMSISVVLWKCHPTASSRDLVEFLLAPKEEKTNWILQKIQELTQSRSAAYQAAIEQMEENMEKMFGLTPKNSPNEPPKDQK